jgi:hypothetical protein
MGDQPGENASIEDFLGESGGASADEDERPDSDDLGGRSDSDDSDRSDGEATRQSLPDERGQTTAQITPAGRTCESCETTAMRLWHDDGQFVCCSCKQWE